MTNPYQLQGVDMSTMVWICMAVFWVTFASRETLHKWLLTHAKQQVSVSLLIAAEAIVCGIILVAWGVRHGLPTFQEHFWWFLLVTATLNPLLFGLNAKAKQLADLSAVEPILIGGSATFVFISERFVSVVLGRAHEAISVWGCAGLAVMGLGVYIALLKPGLRFTEPLRTIMAQRGVAVAFVIGFVMAVIENRLGYVNPWVTSAAGLLMLGVIIVFAVTLKRQSPKTKTETERMAAHLKQDLGIRCAFLGAFLGSWSSIFDKYATMSTSDGTFPAGVIMLIVGTVYAIAAFRAGDHRTHGLTRVAGLSLGLGLLAAVAIGSYWIALPFGQITYIAPLKRVALVLTVPMAFLLLQERTNMKRRLAGSLLVVGGTFLLAFGG